METCEEHLEEEGDSSEQEDESDSLAESSDEEEGLDAVRPRFRRFLRNIKKKGTKKSPKISRKKKLEVQVKMRDENEDGSSLGNPKTRNRRGNLLVRVDGASAPIRKIERVARMRKGLRSQGSDLFEIVVPLEFVKSENLLDVQEVDATPMDEVPNRSQPQEATIHQDSKNCSPAPDRIQSDSYEIGKGMKDNVVDPQIGSNMASLEDVNHASINRNAATV